MKELIKIGTTSIGDGNVQTVNARDIYEFLGIGKDFSSWIKNQIDRARLVEGVDYIIIKVYAKKGVNSKGGRPADDYYLTIEAGKHICMLSGTDKGFEVCGYFHGVRKDCFIATSPLDHQRSWQS